MTASLVERLIDWHLIEATNHERAAYRLVHEQTAAELTRLQAELDAVRADAEPWLWMQSNYSSLMCTHQGMAPKVTFQKCLLHKDFTPDMLKAAISAAMKKEPR